MPINVFATLDDPAGVDTTASGIGAEFWTASFAEQRR
jgi:hypothetical protein